jgi:hypothetical protein
MTLKSALQDLKETTLAAVAGLLGKLTYLASLRGSQGRYEHWGLEAVHGPESSERAMKTAHSEVVTGILRAPLATLEKDLQQSSRGSGVTARTYVQRLRDRFEDLLPGERKDSPAASHLNSVLVALSSLEKSRERATLSASWRRRQPVPVPRRPGDGGESAPAPARADEAGE